MPRRTPPTHRPPPDAERAATARDPLPTTLGSAGIAAALGAEERARAVFSARTAKTAYLSVLKKVITSISAGELDHASARLTLRETLAAMGYEPETGFPDDPAGEIPPAARGGIRDLSSRRRLDLILRTQRDLMVGRGWQARGMEPDRMAAFPAWELVRARLRREPRRWLGAEGTPPRLGGVVDERARWAIAGGRIYPGGRMIAFKGDPVWGELGSTSNFDDALDVDHPPFAFNSGMGWREIPLSECRRLGVTGPAGETVAQWQRGELRLISDPPARLSKRGIDPELARHAVAAIPDAVETPEGIALRRSDRLARAVARSLREYQARQEARHD